MDIKAELQKIKSYLMSAEVTETPTETVTHEFASYDLESGGSVKIEGEIAVGSVVTVTDENGNDVPAPDGEHVLVGVAKIVVKDGSIAEIYPLEETAPEVEVEVEQAVDTTALPEYVAEPMPDHAKEMESLSERITKLEGVIADLMTRLDGMSKANTAMTAVIEEMSKTPTAEAVKPAQFSFINKKEDVYSRLEKLKNSINK
jgi:hypothetical protein